MNTIQTALSSARFNRLILWIGVGVFAVGRGGARLQARRGSDATNATPTRASTRSCRRRDPAEELQRRPDPRPSGRSTRRSGRRSVRSSSARRAQEPGLAWQVVAPSVKQGYTYKSWSKANALPINYYPVDDVTRAQYLPRLREHAGDPDRGRTVSSEAVPDAADHLPARSRPGRQGRPRQVARRLLHAALDAAGPAELADLRSL